MVCGSRVAPSQTRERFIHRAFRSAVEFCPALLGWRLEVETEGWKTRDAPWKGGGGLGWAHATLSPGSEHRSRLRGADVGYTGTL